MALTPKQQQFVQEYLVDLNATQAAIRAGYSEHTAEKIGSENLHKPEIAAAITLAMDARSERTGITADSVLARLNRIADRCMQATPVMVYDRETKSMVQAYDDAGKAIYEFDSAGANRALEILAKHLRLLTDRVEHSASAGFADLLEEARARARGT